MKPESVTANQHDIFSWCEASTYPLFDAYNVALGLEDDRRLCVSVVTMGSSLTQVPNGYAVNVIPGTPLYSSLECFSRVLQKDVPVLSYMLPHDLAFPGSSLTQTGLPIFEHEDSLPLLPGYKPIELQYDIELEEGYWAIRFIFGFSGVYTALYRTISQAVAHYLYLKKRSFSFSCANLDDGFPLLWQILDLEPPSSYMDKAVCWTPCPICGCSEVSIFNLYGKGSLQEGEVYFSCCPVCYLLQGFDSSPKALEEYRNYVSRVLKPAKIPSLKRFDLNDYRCSRTMERYYWLNYLSHPRVRAHSRRLVRPLWRSKE